MQVYWQVWTAQMATGRAARKQRIRRLPREKRAAGRVAMAALVCLLAQGTMLGQAAAKRQVGLQARIGLPQRVAAGSKAEPLHWVATWGTAQQLVTRTGVTGRAPGTPPPTPNGNGPQRRFAIPVGLPKVENQTLRMFVRSSLGGQPLRVRLYNALGGAGVQLGKVTVALRKRGSAPNSSAIDAATLQTLTFGGQTSATLYAGQMLYSDPVAMALPPLTDLAVSIYLPKEVTNPTVHLFGLRTTFVSTPGDHTEAAELPAATTTESHYLLAGVDVAAAPQAFTLVTLGDSITDGDQSTLDAHNPWPSGLAARLQSNPKTRHIGVVNAGISGNRVLGDGQSALARFTNDVLAVPNVRWMTLLEGINDINGGTRATANPKLTAEDLIRAYQQLLARAHAHGIRVIGCTILPWGGSTVYNETGEAVREKVNQWIRESGAFDAVVDFDKILRDPADPKRLRREADSPDLLHPGDAGYRLMGEAFPLEIFTAPRQAKRGQP